MNQALINSISHIPESLTTSPGFMNELNQELTIFSGPFTIKNASGQLTGAGRIYWDWFPRIGLRLDGQFDTDTIEAFVITEGTCKVDAGAFKDIECLVFEVGTKGMESVLTGQVIEGDTLAHVTKVRFELLNFRELLGDNIRNGTGLHKGRFVFEDDEYRITIDAKWKVGDLMKQLKIKGGFITTYIGEIECKKKQVSFEEAGELLACLSQFLAFVNGRRCYPVFRQGFNNDVKVWTDYKNYRNEPYKYTSSWVVEIFPLELNDLWKSFRLAWQKDAQFLVSIIHWYVEANQNAGAADGSLIMAQTGLELLFNQLVPEEQKQKKYNKYAANKFRTLLSMLHLDPAIPETFTDLRNFLASIPNLAPDNMDGPGALVELRNAIVHSDKDFQDKLHLSDDLVRLQALQVAIHYIEVTLLFFLSYKGDYLNRCAGSVWHGSQKQKLPWLNTGRS